MKKFKLPSVSTIGVTHTPMTDTDNWRRWNASVLLIGLTLRPMAKTDHRDRCRRMNQQKNDHSLSLTDAILNAQSDIKKSQVSHYWINPITHVLGSIFPIRENSNEQFLQKVLKGFIPLVHGMNDSYEVAFVIRPYRAYVLKWSPLGQHVVTTWSTRCHL